MILIGIYINAALFFVSLWLAFGKANRPITWDRFWFNLVAAGINLLAILLGLYNLP